MPRVVASVVRICECVFGCFLGLTFLGLDVPWSAYMIAFQVGMVRALMERRGTWRAGVYAIAVPPYVYCALNDTNVVFRLSCLVMIGIDVGSTLFWC